MTPATDRGRILARPGGPSGSLSPGLHRIEPVPGRAAMLAVPAGYRPEQPAPFVLSLHGAGGDERAGLHPLHDLVDETGLILLAPASLGRTWDLLLGGFGPDSAFIDAALNVAFARCSVDPERIAIAGFSDGASYALSLGLTNGDLFRTVLAFSPGFMAPAAERGEPRIFISHGTRDDVLAIDVTSRRAAPRLRRAGYDLRYREFDGGHTVPADIARGAVAWWLSDTAAAVPG
jgi:phospholipase/carboxylesterase